MGMQIFLTQLKMLLEVGADATMIYVPAKFAADAIMEAADAEIELIVCITEGIPILDMIKVKEKLKGSKSRLIGPNCPGVITPESVKLELCLETFTKKVQLELFLVQEH